LRCANPPYDPLLRRHPVHRANFVAVEIPQIGEVHFSCGAFAYARRIFAGLAAIGEAGRVPGVSLLGRVRRKADGAAIGVRRGLAVDRLRHRKYTGLGEVENSVAVDPGWPDIERAQQRVIERLGFLEVVGADHDMRKHSSIPPQFSNEQSRSYSRGGTTPYAARCRAM